MVGRDKIKTWNLDIFFGKQEEGQKILFNKKDIFKELIIFQQLFGWFGTFGCYKFYPARFSNIDM